MPCLYSQLAAIARNNPQLLVSYQDDLHSIDRRALEKAKAGDEYVWLLRRLGTELFPIRKGFEPISVVHWLSEDVLAFRLTAEADGGAEGRVVLIDEKEARRLAELAPPKGACLWVPSGFSLHYKRDGAILGRVSNFTGRGFDAMRGEHEYLSTHDTPEQAMAAVEAAAS